MLIIIIAQVQIDLDMQSFEKGALKSRRGSQVHFPSHPCCEGGAVMAMGKKLQSFFVRAAAWRSWPRH
jgi:hypothetical protein